jgi:hypothetical protein
MTGLQERKIPRYCVALLVLLLVLFLAGTSFPFSNVGSTFLMISSPKEEGKIIYRIPVGQGDEFTLTYRHSVSNSVVYGTFALTDEGTIEPLTTVFLSYGPGLPMAGGGENTTIEDGVITVYHQEVPREDLRLWVSPLTGETLTIRNETYDLAALSEEPMLIEITLKMPGPSE